MVRGFWTLVCVVWGGLDFGVLRKFVAFEAVTLVAFFGAAVIGCCFWIAVFELLVT